MLAINISISFTVCPSDFYGYMCKIPCSGNCLKKKSCDHIDGTCVGGCKAGYTGKLCTVCKILYFTFSYGFVIY